MTTEATRPDGVVIRESSPRELKERMDRGDRILLVDVREPFEPLIADIPDGEKMRIPVREIPMRGAEVDPDLDVVVYCRSGPRSAWAVERLMEMGHPNVLNLRGGILAWRTQVDPTIQSY